MLSLILAPDINRPMSVLHVYAGRTNQKNPLVYKLLKRSIHVTSQPAKKKCQVRSLIPIEHSHNSTAIREDLYNPHVVS